MADDYPFNPLWPSGYSGGGVALVKLALRLQIYLVALRRGVGKKTLVSKSPACENLWLRWLVCFRLSLERSRGGRALAKRPAPELVRRPGSPPPHGAPTGLAALGGAEPFGCVDGVDEGGGGGFFLSGHTA